MNYLKPAAKRDITLDYLKRYKHRQIAATELRTYLQATDPDNFTLDDIGNALHILQYDGLVRNNPQGLYQITLKGEILAENGGYIAKKVAEATRADHQQFAAGFDNQDTSLHPWVLAMAGILFVLAIVRCGFLFWHWNIPF